MLQRKLSKQQFDLLYELNLPRLYRAALCLTGDFRTAEHAAGEAFLNAAVQPAYNKDTRLFAVEAMRGLCEICAEEKAVYQQWAATSAGMSTWQAQRLGEFTMRERALVVLSSVLEMGAPEIAAILQMPAWLVKLRLRVLAQALVREEQRLEEELELYVSTEMAGPFS